MGLARNRLEATPRTIGPMLAAQMLFGGGATTVGWLLVAFGFIFGWVFAAHADLTGWRFRQGEIATVAGTAAGCEDTGYSIGGSEGSRGTPVFENHYQYRVGDQEYAGWSYATGRCLEGEPVIVEYLPAQPGYSRIQGMRRELLGPWALLAALIPGIGFAIAIAGFYRGVRRIHLLRDGLTAAGRVTSKAPTGARTMGRAEYRITVEFTARDGRTRSTTVTTNEPERLGDEAQECILYHPGNPDYAVPIDALPGKLTLDHSGRILPGPPRRYLILPIVSAVLNAWFAWRHWS
jgi:hypothetical protein